MCSDRARLLAWAASAHNVAVVAAVAFILATFATAEIIRTNDLHFAEPGNFANPQGLTFVGVPTAAYQHVLVVPGLASGTIGPRSAV